VFSDVMGPQEIERIADALADAVERYGAEQPAAAPDPRRTLR
jgi:hypothetical protein